MTAIELEVDTIPRKHSFTRLTSEERSRANSTVDVLAVDYDTLISSVVPPVVNNNDENDEDIPLFSSRKVYKNLIVISLGFILLLTAYSGILSLQSSLNTKGNVGINSLIVSTVFTLFGALFLTNFFMNLFGLKWTMIIGSFGYIAYVAANIRPTPTLMYIGAALLGLSSAPVWASQATYIDRIARFHAYHKQKHVDVVVSLFFGIFFAFLGTCTIWGNLISYFVLNQSNDAQKFNCGVHFDPLAKTATNSSGADVPDSTRYLLCGIFIGAGVISVILPMIFLDQIRLAKSQSMKESLIKSLDVIRSLFRWRHIDQFLLVPITVWTMVESSFVIAQFTRAFVTCLVGIRFIGLVMICNGILNTLSSYMFGSLVKCIGRLGCFIIASTINFSMIALMYFWDPVPEQMWILFVIAGGWGTAAAAWQSQVVATYTVLYAKTDSSAIAKYRFWKAIGNLITYSYASYVDIRITLIVLTSILTISMIFYVLLEIHIRWKDKMQKKSIVLNDGY